jgi:Fur family ferric uptake transcriptional regulator
MDLTSAKDTLTRYLQEKNLRPTRERFTLLEEIMRGNGHFDAEEFYIRVKSKGLKVSRATVYNTLDLLVACGLISKYHFGEDHSRYEKAFGRPRHDHLICLECGDIIEFVNPKLNAILDDVSKEKRFKMQSSTLQIFGVCSKCQSKKPRS